VSQNSCLVAKVLNVYYKKRKILGKMDNVATDFLKEQLDLKLQVVSLIPGGLIALANLSNRKRQT